jgi:hypothetical protein
MIAIDKVLISDDVIEARFVCDLSACKGACCEDGDAGAPLTSDELDRVSEVFETVKPFLTAEGLAEINLTGLYRYDREFGWVTPTVDGKICAYGFRDEKGIITCAFEKAFREGLTNWKKPISCHLYPVKISKRRYNDCEMMNYEPREVLCAPGCVLGESLQVPVYLFLKEAIVRKYGVEFFKALEKVAQNYYTEKHT